jgi:hypothetical protein
MAVLDKTETDALTRFGLGWLITLKGSELYHTEIAINAFGRERYEEIIDWMTEASVYPRWLIELLFDDFLAYKQARAMLEDVDEPLVIAILPDFAQHLFLLNTKENRRLDMLLAGKHIDHDTAGTTAPLGSFDELNKTVGIFVKFGIDYHEELWQDDVRFLHGACLIPTGITAVPAS